MKKYTRVLSFVVALAMLITLFVGCGGDSTKDTAKDTPASTASGSSTEGSAAQGPATYAENGLPKDQEVTLKIGLWEAGVGREWFDLSVADFQKKFPNVKIEITSSPTITELVKTKIAANNTDDMFDMFYYGWSDLAKDNKAETLEDILDRDLYDKPGTKVRDVLPEGLAESLVYYKDGHLYYIPQMTYMSGLFFDENLFDQNGWNKDPKTWDEFLKLCEDIKAKGIVPIATTGMYDYESFVFTAKEFELAEQNGNKDFRKNYRTYRIPYYNSPENQERWKRLSEMGKKGYIDPASVSMNHTQSQMMAIQHKAAMVISGDWVENEMKDSTPKDFKWAYMNVPFTNDPNIPIYIGNGINYNFCVYKEKPDLQKKWAKELILWLFNMQTQQYIVEKGGCLPIRKDYQDDAARTAAMKNSQKSALNYAKNHKVQFVDNAAWEVVLTHPNAAKADKFYKENCPVMAVGKKDPGPILQQADELLKVAVDDYDKQAK